MGETIMDYGSYNLWNDGLSVESLPLTTNESFHWGVRGNDDNCGVTVSKELIDNITKEVAEQIRNKHDEIKVIEGKYHLNHR